MIKLGWDENVTFSGHTGVRMRFRIASVAVGKRSGSSAPRSRTRRNVCSTSFRRRTSSAATPGPRCSCRRPITRPAAPNSTSARRPWSSRRSRGRSRPGSAGEARSAGGGKIPRRTLIYMGFGQFQVPNDPDESPLSWNSGDSFRLQ